MRLMKLLVFAPFLFATSEFPTSESKESKESLLKLAKERIHNGDFKEIVGIDKNSLIKLINTLTLTDSLENVSIQSLIDTFQLSKKCHYKCSSRKQNPLFTHQPFIGCKAFIVESNYNFSSCCDERTQCIGVCGKRRDECDDAFNKCMISQCKTTYKKNDNETNLESLTLKDLESLKPNSKSFKSCRVESRAFYQIARMTGCESYLTIQKEACQCFNVEL